MDQIDLPFEFVPPFVSEDIAPFFEGCEAEEFRLQQCNDCETFRFPPMPACASCASLEHTWRVAAMGEASLATWTVHHRPADRPPYAVAIVKLAREGVHFATNIIDFDPDMSLSVDQPMAVEFRRESTTGTALPYVRPLS